MKRLPIICLMAYLLISSSCKEEIAELNEVQATRNYTIVEVAPITITDDPIAIHGIGRVASDKEVKLSFKIGGIISSMAKDEGDYVKAGTVLATMRTNEIDAQVLKAQRALQKAERDLDRVNKMYADSAATLEAVQDLTTLVEISTADLEVAQFNQKYARVISPISGRILRRLAEPNELVSPGQPIFIIASSQGGAYIMKAALSDKEINKVNYNDKVDITFDAYQHQTFSGKIVQIAESADPRTGTFDIEISIDNGKNRLRNGYIGRISILPNQKISYAKIPMDAIVEASDNQLTLFSPIQQDTIAKEWQISPLQIDGKYVLIRADGGLPERVITSGAPYLVDGDIIHIKS